MGDFCQCGDIHQLGQRVGRRLDKQQLGVGLDCRIPAGQFGQRHIINLHAEALEILFKQADGRTEHTARHQDMVPGAAQAHDHRQDGCHARRRGYGLLGTFKGGNALFESTDRRVGVTRINVACHLARKPRCRVGGRAEHIAGGQEHRIAVFAFWRTVLACAHRQGVERYAVEVAVQPTCIPILTHAATPCCIRETQTGPSGPVW